MPDYRVSLRRSEICAVVGLAIVISFFVMLSLGVVWKMPRGPEFMRVLVLVLVLAGIGLIVASRALIDKALSQYARASDESGTQMSRANQSITRLTRVRTWSNVIGICGLVTYYAWRHWHLNVMMDALVIVGCAFVIEMITYVGLAVALSREPQAGPTVAA